MVALSWVHFPRMMFHSFVQQVSTSSSLKLDSLLCRHTGLWVVLKKEYPTHASSEPITGSVPLLQSSSRIRFSPWHHTTVVRWL